MTAKSDLLIDELVAACACIVFGRQVEPDWQTRIETARVALKAYVVELEAAQRWIPVSEPPKVSGKYLLLNIYDDVYPCDFIAGTEIWVLPDYDTITHWMPLPQPPEGKFDQLTARWRQERQDDKWIPVSERLPEDGEVVWLWDGNNMGMGYYLIFSGCFMDRDTPLRQIKPTHWMPLPEPPIVYGKECEE